MVIETKKRLEILEKIGSLAILEELADAISIQDTDLRVLFQNKSHRQLMGDQLGRYCFEAYQKRDTPCPECHLLDSFKTGKTFRRETSTKHSTRGLVHVEITSTPLRNSKGVIVAGIEAVRDITERKLLTERVNAITADLEQRTWKLMAANNELESFSYTLSHDIHNYIARIAMASYVIKEDFSAVIDEKGKFLLSHIEESCSDLERLVDSTLLLCRSGRGEIAREPVDLTALAEEVVEELWLQYPDRSVAIDVAPGLSAVGDWQLLKIALKNLLGNAWKYTVNTPQPHIRFFAEEEGGRTVFTVQDNGCGFEMEEVARLFKPFSRLKSARDIKGTGIGLATVRKVVEAHGGEIWAEGDTGTGAAFYFTISSPKV